MHCAVGDSCLIRQGSLTKEGYPRPFQLLSNFLKWLSVGLPQCHMSICSEPTVAWCIFGTFSISIWIEMRIFFQYFPGRDIFIPGSLWHEQVQATAPQSHQTSPSVALTSELPFLLKKWPLFHQEKSPFPVGLKCQSFISPILTLLSAAHTFDEPGAPKSVARTDSPLPSPAAARHCTAQAHTAWSILCTVSLLPRLSSVPTTQE